MWTSGGFNPSLRIFDTLGNPLIRWSTGERYLNPVDAGTYYVVASSSAAGRYRLHVAGGGKGHDDVVNVLAEAMKAKTIVKPSQGTEEPPRDLAGETVFRIDFGRDQDFFKFEVPAGSPRWVRVYTSANIDTWGALYDTDEIQLENNDNHGDGSNFLIDRVLEPGTYYVGVWGRSADTTGPYRLHISVGDDHGNLFATASRVQLPSVTPGSIDYVSGSADRDVFWFQVSTRGNVVIQTTSSFDTIGVLYDSDRIELERNDRSGPGSNFLIDRVLESGTYYISVTRDSFSSWGSYNLHLSGEASGVAILPLVPPANDPLQRQGFVRVINHSDEEVALGITAVDEAGTPHGPIDLKLEPWETIHFNSDDLEDGNSDKGIAAGVGSGMGNWYLELAPSRPDVEVLGFIRTSDGFVTSMHALAPSDGREHRVMFFNPGSNTNQESKLRLIYPRCAQAESGECVVANVTIFGVDDDGARSPDVALRLEPGTAREVTAAQLEGLDAVTDFDLEGRLGDGEGKWQLLVSADQPIQVLSLLETPTGHITNLSAPATRQVFSTALPR